MSAGHPEITKKLQSGVFPGTQGGPMMHTILAKAIAYEEALQPAFKTYQQQVIANSQCLAKALAEKGYRLVSDRPENHIVLLDLSDRDFTGAQAEQALEKARIIANKNTIPGDKRPALETSGLRFGTPAVTTRGFKEAEIIELAGLIDRVLSDITSDRNIADVANAASAMCHKFKLEEVV